MKLGREPHECAPPEREVSSVRARLIVHEPPPLGSVWLCWCGRGWVVRPTFARGGHWSGPDRGWLEMTALGSWWLRRRVHRARRSE